jgi:thiamine-phosphate pyrophosphorylase
MAPKKEIYRVIDANFNRLREGIRVLEEVERLVLSRKRIFLRLKRLRHAVADCHALLPAQKLLVSRNSRGDVGRKENPASEFKRRNLAHIVASNAKRCQEAARVLEEFTKLVSPRASAAMKEIRFGLYDLEKEF